MNIDDIIELLDCNLNNINLVDTIGKDGIAKAIKYYEISTNEHRNYATDSPELSDWYNDGIEYPETNWFMKQVLDIVKTHKPSKVLEAGAGSGKLAKMVYDVLDGDVELSCIENNKVHYNQMITNFSTPQYNPKRIVKATTILGSIHDIPQLEDKMFNLTYTHTVMMHIPFISAVMVAAELARVTKDYIYHIENKNVVSCVYPLPGRPGAIPNFNRLMIDYKKLYTKLGFETKLYTETGNTVAETCICYLGKRK